MNFIKESEEQKMKIEEMKQLVNLLNQYGMDKITQLTNKPKQLNDFIQNGFNHIDMVKYFIQQDIDNYSEKE